MSTPQPRALHSWLVFPVVGIGIASIAGYLTGGRLGTALFTVLVLLIVSNIVAIRG